MGTAVAAADAPDSNPGRLQEIIVTAQRREENLQKVPVSVTALPTRALEQKQVGDVLTLAKVVPGLQSKPTLTPLEISIAIRGVTQLVPSINVDPAIGSYVDGVYNVVNAGSNNAMIDMERVEVLKGPQGTLFGRNTIGGAISITTAKPTDRLGGYTEVDIGNYGQLTTTGVVNLPLAPGLLDTRFVYQHSQHDGYGRNITLQTPTGTLNQNYMRGSVKFDPSGSIDLIATGFYDRASGYTFPTQLAYFDPTASLAPGVLPPTNIFIPIIEGHPGDAITNYEGHRGTYDDYSNLSGRFSLKQYGATGTVTAHLGPIASIKSITGYTHTDYNTIADLDGTPYTILQLDGYPIRTNQYSQELQIYGKALGDRLSWIAGAYYFQVKGSQTSESEVLSGLSLLSPPYRVISNHDGAVVNNKSYSAFAQGTFAIANDLRLTGGLRYVIDKRAVAYHDHGVFIDDGDYAGCNLANDPGGQNPSTCSFGQHVKFHYLPWTVGIEYQATPSILLYTKYSTGYRSGAYPLSGPALTTPGATVTPAQAAEANARAISLFGPVSPEKLTSPEVGVKADLLDRHLRINAAGYYSVYANIQETVNSASDPNCPTCGVVAILANSGRAHIYGGEIEVTAVLGQGFELDASLGYTRPKYVAGPFIGTPIINVSKLNSAVTGSYETSVLGSKLTLVGTWSYRSKMVEYTLSPGLATTLLDTITQRGFSLFDARISMEVAHTPITVSLYAQNIANKHYIGAATSFAPPLNYTSTSPGVPRTYGASAKMTF